MYAQKERTKENESRAVANSVRQKRSNGKQGYGFVDNRNEAIAQRKLQEVVNNSSQTKQATQLHASSETKYSTIQRFYAVKDKKNERENRAARKGRVERLGLEWIDLPDPRNKREYPDTVAGTGWWFRNLYKRKGSPISEIKEKNKKSGPPKKSKAKVEEQKIESSGPDDSSDEFMEIWATRLMNQNPGRAKKETKTHKMPIPRAGVQATMGDYNKHVNNSAKSVVSEINMKLTGKGDSYGRIDVLDGWNDYRDLGFTKEKYYNDVITEVKKQYPQSSRADRPYYNWVYKDGRASNFTMKRKRSKDIEAEVNIHLNY